MNHLLNTYRVRAYLRFWWKSTNQHGVHSPFVYQLVTQCFYDYKFYPAYDQLKAQRTHFLQHSELLVSSDFNVGEVCEGKYRDYREIVRTSAKGLNRTRLLNRLVRYLRLKCALEVGTSFGLVAAAMATQNEITIKSIQESPIMAEIARKNSAVWGLNQVEVYNTNLSQLINGLGAQKQHVFDLVYFNRRDRPETILDYFEQLLPFVHNESVFVLEDIHSTPEAEITWETIKKHPKVKVSIDTFKWGLIFLRREQVKEHFVIRT